MKMYRKEKGIEMKTSDNGIQLIKKFEGISTKAYFDAVGKLTIGYGHTTNVSIGQIITKEQAEIYLKEDLQRFEDNVNKYNKTYNWNQNEFDALVSFAFNTGSIDTLTINGRRSKKVICEKMLLYNKGTINKELKEIPGLTTRREAEQELFLKDVVKAETVINDTSVLTDIEIKRNIQIVQEWLNKDYEEYFRKCKSVGCKRLMEDGINGNKTRAAITIALQIYMNELGLNLEIDGYYQTMTNNAVKKYIAIQEGINNVSAKIVQAVLYLYGYNPQVFQGEFTKDCVIALKLCQSDNKLNPDGIAGAIFFTKFLEQR